MAVAVALVGGHDAVVAVDDHEGLVVGVDQALEFNVHVGYVMTDCDYGMTKWSCLSDAMPGRAHECGLPGMARRLLNSRLTNHQEE